ncbi:GTP-binding protein Obg/CgtA [Thermocrinis albus DSM 14484]|uniref:GTPase Obg n=1 Tax=Thermocrinis albus (strain DSM 14484 / JCM 11386 / HI 11/12) TaxID=638303 RepID=D3SQ71_THEAH|nr:GTPase ObgE [Thermocrinis albus]ADC89308.1 GTP-binding protein Obg/CgtA [Thermocrinis albus DSM 14484]
MFVDRVKIWVKGGRGGDGAVAFLREKYRPFGGPAGGDGGNGGSVILVGTSRKHTLLDFKYKKHFKAKDGEHGKGKNQHGKDGEDLVLEVPLGTVVKDALTGEVICDIVEEGQRCVVAKGGRGGRGNARFATPTHQAPRYAEKGQEGEERWIILELKLIADVGLVGLPNAGKSTLISKLTRARPKIADYPFTTLSPVLGVLEIDEERRLVLADIPGLIEGASQGRGLGHEFLRHIERTRILLHLVDISDGASMDPVEAFRIVNKELGEYSEELLKKPQIVVGTKLDALSDRTKLDTLKRTFEDMGYPFLAVSAVTGEGLDQLVDTLWSVYVGTVKHVA